MTSPTSTDPSFAKGTYLPRQPTDKRSPCPAVNALANHGYISRDGRNISRSELQAALGELGISSFLSTFFTYPCFIELPVDSSSPPPSWWTILSNPLAYSLSAFAMRRPNQQTAQGVAVLDLDQLAKHNAIEHDVSLTRRDFHQGGNNSDPQPDLIKDLLAASNNTTTITISDFVKLRKTRLACQKRENERLQFGAFQNQLACAEVALILTVLGDGREVPVSYVKSLFEEERLPRKEGWKKRSWWWSVGFVEMNLLAEKVKWLVGDIGG